MTDNRLAPSPPRRSSSAARLMWITPDRVFYAGLLGEPAMHRKGSIQVYVAMDGPLRIRIEGDNWQTTEVAVVQPYVAHQAACEARHVLVVYVEPETVDVVRLPKLLRAPSGAVDASGFAAHVRRCHARMVATGRKLDLLPGDFDIMIFGEPLPARRLDRRIADVLDRIKLDPGTPAVADLCAEQVQLSFSRFLHLFKNEVGVPFRRLRTWKRARCVLHHVHASTNLTYVALDVGYPDSTQFSHSIRHSFGLKPKDMMAGSRKLRLIDGTAVADRVAP